MTFFSAANAAGNTPSGRPNRDGSSSRPSGRRFDDKKSVRKPNTGKPTFRPKKNDGNDIISKAVTQAKNHAKTSEPQSPAGKRPSSPANRNSNRGPESRRQSSGGGQRSGGARGKSNRPQNDRGGAFSSPVRMDTYKNAPYNKTGSDTDALSPKGERVKVAILGGNEEVGRNCTMIEYGKDIILIDIGLQFPDLDMPGVDYIVPNISCLKGKEQNIRGVIVTHAHLDHIGGIPHLVPRLGNPPIFATDLTGAIIKKRQEDYKGTPPLNIQTVNSNDVLRLGAFTIEFFGVSHSIPSSMGVVIKTKCGTIVHTGDFKLDPSKGSQSNEERDKMIKLGKEGVTALLIDSTNASATGRQISEGEIQTNIDEIIQNATGRIIIGTFSSMIARVQQILLACERNGRKVAIEGYSMKSNIKIAQELGYVKIDKGTLIESRELVKLPPEKTAVICTGAQGEERAVLMRIANREHPFIEIEPGDTVVFSSSVIPGNERSVQRVKDTLYREGANVIHYKMMDVHAGGHAKQEDLQEMHAMMKPKYLVPIEGHHAFLREHAKAATDNGFKKENIFIADNGQIMEFDENKNGQLTNKKLPTEYVFVDGLGVGNTNQVVLRDRQELAGDGIVIVLAVVSDRTGDLLATPDIISRGFLYMKEHQELIQKARQKSAEILRDDDPRSSANGTYLKEKLRDELGSFLYVKTQLRPMILPIIIEA
ncbi:MAG: ribonuclease J [bacterium]|nr:ribonuclease J [bacterium]